MATTIYTRVEQLKERLVQEGLGDWNDRLTDAIKGGATSGEILVRLARVLDNLKGETGIGAETRSDARRLLDEVDRLLAPPTWNWNPELGRYEPPGQPTPIEFSYALIGTGWSEAYMSDGRNWLRPTASYLSDALRAFTDAVDAVVRGRDRVACMWEEEPGNFLWLFEGQGSSVTVSVYWNDRGFDQFWWNRLNMGGPDYIDIAFEPPVGRLPGELRGRFATTRHELGVGVLGALDKLADDLGDQGYLDKWSRHPFPHREHERLRAALRPGISS